MIVFQIFLNPFPYSYVSQNTAQTCVSSHSRMYKRIKKRMNHVKDVPVETEI
jgi:hypothetical protein